MGGHFDGVLARNRGQSQRRAFRFGVRRQTLEFEFKVPDGAVGCALLRQRQRPIGSGALDEQIDARSCRRFDIDDDANYGDVMHVMDLCRGAGVKTLGIMTK